MSIADILISIITWTFQKMILPIFPVNLPLLPYQVFVDTLQGSLKHNLSWAFAGLNQLFNLKILFTILIIIIFAEILFWLVRSAIFLIKLIRG